jgi:hypothetical protein
MKRLVLSMIASLLMLVAASGAFAQYENPCEGDIARFCSNLAPGRGAIANCLSQNEAQLSPACKEMHLSKLADVLRQTQQVCEADSSKFCGAELQEQGIKLLNCLRINAPGLSPDCKKKLFEALELMHY